MRLAQQTAHPTTNLDAGKESCISGVGAYQISAQADRSPFRGVYRLSRVDSGDVGRITRYVI